MSTLTASVTIRYSFTVEPTSLPASVQAALAEGYAPEDLGDAADIDLVNRLCELDVSTADDHSIGEVGLEGWYRELG